MYIIIVASNSIIDALERVRVVVVSVVWLDDSEWELSEESAVERIGWIRLGASQSVDEDTNEPPQMSRSRFSLNKL